LVVVRLEVEVPSVELEIDLEVVLKVMLGTVLKIVLEVESPVRPELSELVG